jgi:hypothetical protein
VRGFLAGTVKKKLGFSLTTSNQSEQRNRPTVRGSILDADPPAQGVKIARRITFQSGAALSTVVGVLVEVPVMLSVVHLVRRSRGWYEQAAPAAHA